MLELVLTHPSYRQNVVTFALLYVAGGGIPLAVSLPLAIKHRYWRSIWWLPTWFAYAFLRRLATLEAVISLPTRPFPALAGARSAQRRLTRAQTQGYPHQPLPVSHRPERA
jgi:hypothetical protein